MAEPESASYLGTLLLLLEELLDSTYWSRDESRQGCCPCGPVQGIRKGTENIGLSGFGVYLHSREVFYTHVDLEIPGRGFPWRLARKYRSRTQHNGILGHNWFLEYKRRLVLIREEITPLDDFGFPPAVPRFEKGDVVRVDGLSRVDVYKPNPDGSYRSPRYFYTRLMRLEDGSFLERDPHGNKVRYDFPDGAGVARMVALSDHHGNTMRFEHDRLGRLVKVIDTLGRPITYHYNADGRLILVQDFTDRQVRFVYDANGDLVESVSPVVTGTPNENDFPNGKTTRYVYRDIDHPIFGHDLIQLYLPNDVEGGGDPRIEIRYVDDYIFNATIGGISSSGVPAGGTVRFSDRSFFGQNPFDPDLKVDLNEVVAETDVTDRNGNLITYGFNKLKNILSRKEFTNRDIRPGDPEFFETRFEYNQDGEMVRINYPEGNSIDYVLDAANPDRFQQGNPLRITETPDIDRSGDQEEITTTLVYEPIYNQIHSVTEARGNDPGYLPQNGGVTSPKRYTTIFTFDYQEGDNLAALAEELSLSGNETQALLAAAGISLNLGDINDDGIKDDIGGDAVQVESPSVNLLPGSNMAAVEESNLQPVVSFYAYNHFGQITALIDPEGNLTELQYYPENDPDGDGANLTPGVSSEPYGYLKQINRDIAASPERNSGSNPTPTSVRRRFLYDPVGNVIRQVNGRGIRTDYSLNQLNQVVQVTRASGHNSFGPEPLEPMALTDFKYQERLFYDSNDNVVLRQVEDRGDTSSVDGNLLALPLPDTAADRDPAGGTAFVDTVYEYDILDQVVETIQEVGGGSEPLRTRYRYDPNENLTLVIQPEGNALVTVFDERDLRFEETLGAGSPPPATLLSANDPVNYDVRGGEPATKSFHFDLNGNLIEVVDAADTDSSSANNSAIAGNGDRTRYVYDGFDRVTSMIDSAGNQSVTQYDPADNEVRFSRFGPVDGQTPTSDGPDQLPGPVSIDGVIQTANLVNGNLLAATETLYDELSRLFQVDQVLFVNTIDTSRLPDVAEGAADIGKANLTPGDNHPVPGVDGLEILGRVSTRTEHDRNSRATFRVEDDGDTHRTEYDGVGRVIRTVDPESNAVETSHDDNHNAIEVRETDVSQVPGVADEVLLTTYFYDSLNRLQKEVDNLGQTREYRYDSRNNLVAMADASGPGGPIVERRSFPNGALTANTTNQFGNVTRYSYDGIDRQIESEVVLTASGQGDGINAGADLFGVKGDTPAPDATQGGGDGRVKVQFHWDRNSLPSAETDDNGNQTQYEYDNLDRLVVETRGVCVEPGLADRCDPPTTIEFTYDADDNEVRRKDENGTVVESRFDALNRLIDSDIARADGVVGTTAASYEYDGLSRTVAASDNNEPADADDDSVITFAYDSLGRVIEETQRTGGSPPQVISSSWRAENLKTACIYPNARRVETSFDNLDRIDKISDASSVPAIVDYDYIGEQRVARRLYPGNGTRMTYLNDGATADQGYDGLRRPVQLRHLREDNSLVVGFTHDYDRMNNRLNETKLHDPANSEAYAYDSAYRLTGFDRPDPRSVPPPHREWTLDGVGNWKQVDDESRQHSSFNEITSRNSGGVTEVLSDENGNVTDNGVQVFGWDYRNRLRRVTSRAGGTPIASYAYDNLDRRVRKQVGGSPKTAQTTAFSYDGWQVLEERDQLDGAARQFVYGGYIDEPLMMDRVFNGEIIAGGGSDLRLFYHQNSLSSTFALTGTAGSLVEAYLYAAYGKASVFQPGPVVQSTPEGIIGPDPGESGTGNPYLFVGRRLDGETGLYYYRHRYQDPDQGRFIHRDPVPIWGGESGSAYTYVGNNPLNFLDWSGLRRHGGSPPPKPGDTQVKDTMKELYKRLKKAKKDGKKGLKGRIRCANLDSVSNAMCECLNKRFAHDVVECLCTIIPSKSKRDCAKRLDPLLKGWKVWKRYTTGKRPICTNTRCLKCTPELF